MDQHLQNNCLSISHANVTVTMSMTNNEDNANKCKQCDCSSCRAGNLKSHVKKHNGKRSNKCNQCDFASSYANALRTHLQTHLADHMRMVHGFPKLKCTECTAEFMSESVLVKHRRGHSKVLE